MMKVLLPGLLVALALAGCNQKQSTPGDTPGDKAPTSLASVTKSSAFLCQEGMQITAFYGTDDKGKPDLTLVIDGDNFVLVPTPTEDGKRFATATDFRNPGGKQPENGVIWWEKANGDVLLQQAPLAEVGNPDAAKTLRTCERKS